jgi:hypothetical protein
MIDIGTPIAILHAHVSFTSTFRPLHTMNSVDSISTYLIVRTQPHRIAPRCVYALKHCICAVVTNVYLYAHSVRASKTIIMKGIAAALVCPMCLG